MKANKSVIIVAISTIIFGIISKCLVGIPYMSLRHFDLYFVMSFILWILYSAVLYIAGKTENIGQTGIIKTSCQGLIFGVIAACVKTGIDSFIMLIGEKTNNQILLTFAIEIEILLLGSAMMIFVFYVLQKREFIWNKLLNKYVAILGGLTGVYVIIFFSFYIKYQKLAAYTDINSLTENGNMNLNTLLGMESIMQYSKNFTMISVITFVVFFIGAWFILEKSSHTSNLQN